MKSPESLLSHWLESAILAPSAHNTQPWRCEWSEGKLILSNDPAHTLQAGDPTLRQTFLGLGAFLANLTLAASGDGYEVHVEETAFIAESGKPSAVIRFNPKKAPASNYSQLRVSIPLRHTNRGLYEPTLSPSILAELMNSSHNQLMKLDFITDETVKKRIGKLVERGIFIGLSLNPLREELATLVSYQHEQRLDGLLVEAMNQHPQAAKSGSEWLLKQLDPQEEARFNYEKFSTAPLLVIISTAFDGPSAWLEAGQELQYLLLTAAQHGLTHCISAAPIEIPTLAPQLRAETKEKARPQVLVRIGKPQDPTFTIASSRRPLSVIHT